MRVVGTGRYDWLQIVVLLLCVFNIPTTILLTLTPITFASSLLYTYKTATIAIMDAAIITQAVAEVLTIAPTERVLSSS